MSLMAPLTQAPSVIPQLILSLCSVSTNFLKWNSASLCNTNIGLYEAAMKRSSENVFTRKIFQYKWFFSSLNLSVLFKNTFLFNETKVFVINWLKRHDKFQHLFCGALYNKWKCKRRAVPFIMPFNGDKLRAKLNVKGIFLTYVVLLADIRHLLIRVRWLACQQ